ncbi:MAG: bacillithiol biosynthesis cysteine-adding enzyme BshC [Chitinophagales bacterium]
MKTEKIPYEQTNRFGKIIIDYLTQKDILKPFYKFTPEINSFKKAIEDKSKESINRNLLAETIANQYNGVTIKPLAQKNIDALKIPTTFSVVTAHQLNIFTGPLYLIYKTLSTIKLCSELKENYPENNFVPVFWLGSEDHDFEEINHFHLFGKTYTWATDQKGACGRFDPRSLSGILEELQPVFGGSENVEHLLSVFRSAYLESQTLSEAGRKILNELFGDFGLVVVDGDDKYFKSECSAIITDEIFNLSSEKIVNETLEKFPYDAQAKPREINLFYLIDNLRERIIFDKVAGKYLVVNTEISFSPAEIRIEIEQNPGHFSPNVILRPLFQQKVLPSIAFIGGKGEVAYWLQLKNLFDHHRINFPILLLRDSYLLVDNNTNNKIQKLGFNYADLFLDENVLINDYVKKHSSAETNMAHELTVIENEFEKIAKKALNIDPSLEKSVYAEKQTLVNAIRKLEAKLLKAEKNKMETEVARIKAIIFKLFPAGNMQERYDNFIPFYFKYGNGFFDRIIESIEQPENYFKIIVMDEDASS